MTTTSQQPPAGDPVPGGPACTGPEGGARPGSGRRGGRSGLLAALAVVLVVALAVVVWLFLAGPFSSSGRAEREVERTLRDMSSAESFSEFNSHLCADNRVPQDLVDTITASGEQTGTDIDAMLRESIAGSFPADLKVTEVEVNSEGSEATATVESEAQASGDAQTDDGQSGDAQSGGTDGDAAGAESDADGERSEQVRMRNEDGAWKVCEPGVGMGAVPRGEQPS